MVIALVPAYNESERVVGVVEALLPHVDEVVVIDDGSSDDTGIQARGAGATLLRHAVNLGQGAALETGHVYARKKNAQAVLHFDGDGQFDVKDIARAKALLDRGDVDIVLGSRFINSTSKIPWFKRVCILPLARVVNRIFSGLTLTDAHNGFRMLGPRAVAQIKLRHNRMAHATEIVELIRAHDLRYEEIPITVTYHEYGQKMRGGFSVLTDLITGKFIN